jgi:signal transduction histidine kinase/DNA-binding response OmpR family regulator
MVAMGAFPIASAHVGWSTVIDYVLLLGAWSTAFAATLAALHSWGRSLAARWGFWWPLVSALVAVAALSGSLVGGVEVRGFELSTTEGVSNADVVRLALVGWALVALVVAMPAPERRWAKASFKVGLGLAAVAVTWGGLVQEGWLVWSGYAVFVSASCALVVAPARFERRVGASVSLVAMNRVTGGVGLLVCLGVGSGLLANGLDLFEGRAAESAVGLFAVSMTVAAGVVVRALWHAYVREQVLPRVRSRGRFLGITPSHLPWAVAGVVAVFGVSVIEAGMVRARHEWFSALHARLGDAVRFLDWETVRSSAEEFDERRANLRRLLDWEYDVRLAGVCSPHGGIHVLAAVGPRLESESGGGHGRPVSALEEFFAQAGVVGLAEGVQVVPRSGGRFLLGVVRAAGETTSEALSLVAVVDSESWRTAMRARRAVGLRILGLCMLSASALAVYSVRRFNEIEARSLKDQADSDFRVHSDFLAMVSHELRTPLQSVLGYADLAAGEPLPAAAARHVAAARSQGAILLRLLQDVLEYGAVRNGDVRLVREDVELEQVLAEVQRAFATRAGGKGLRVATVLDPDVPRCIEGDRTRLLQVLLNLVDNAVKFTASGVVEVRISRSSPPELVGDGQVLDFLVADTGPGIPVRQLRRVFEPFRKSGEEDSVGGGSGMGLGLAICDQIVRRMGGSILADSVFGRGSTFRVRLPVRESVPRESGDVGARMQRSVTPVTALAGLRFLVVDDNPYVRDFLRESIRGVGGRVWARPDGRSALELARKTELDVVLMDLRLPDMDGCALAEAIRRSAAGARSPWIVGTAAGITDKRLAKVMEAGVDEFLLKPILVPGLVETIRLSPVGGRIGRADPGEAAEAGDDPRSDFLLEARLVSVRMRHFATEGNREQLAAEAHYLANGCLAHRLNDGFARCREIEEMAEQGSTDELVERIDDVRVLLVSAAAGSAR